MSYIRQRKVTLTSMFILLPLDFAASIAKDIMLLAIPCRLTDLMTHKFAM